MLDAGLIPHKTSICNRQRSSFDVSQPPSLVATGCLLGAEASAEAADRSLYTLARGVEAIALRLLGEYKPGRRLQTNVEFYTALLLHGIGFEVPLFTPTFAIGRVSGWIAHALEQQRAKRIIRPQSEYVGPRDRRWTPLAERSNPVSV